MTSISSRTRKTSSYWEIFRWRVKCIEDDETCKVFQKDMFESVEQIEAVLRNIEEEQGTGLVVGERVIEARET